jgi:hypothetical protein
MVIVLADIIMRPFEISTFARQGSFNERHCLAIHMILIILMNPTIMAQITKLILTANHFLHKAITAKDIYLHKKYCRTNPIEKQTAKK